MGLAMHVAKSRASVPCRSDGLNTGSLDFGAAATSAEGAVALAVAAASSAVAVTSASRAVAPAASAGAEAGGLQVAAAAIQGSGTGAAWGYSADRAEAACCSRLLWDGRGWL